MESGRIISRYIRNKQHEPKAKIVAFRNGDRVFIGWSMCNKKDHFDKQIADHIATARAIKWGMEGNKNVPDSIKPEMGKFIERAQKYFKDVDKFPAWINPFVF